MQFIEGNTYGGARGKRELKVLRSNPLGIITPKTQQEKNKSKGHLQERITDHMITAEEYKTVKSPTGEEPSTYAMGLISYGMLKRMIPGPPEIFRLNILV